MRDWWHHYDAYYNMYGGVPRVYDVNENMIVMDYVKGVAVEHHFGKTVILITAWRTRSCHGLTELV